MPILRRAATALLATLSVLSVLCVSLPARATTYSTDFTDLWFNANESGWGVNIIQQYNTMFVTLFVYGTDNTPRWFVASDVEPSPAGSQNVFTGQLFQTNGSSFTATTFDPNARTNLFVGTITFTFDTATTGTLQYVINGVAVTKRITRQTWRNENLTGNYLGGLTASTSNCAPGADTKPILIFGPMGVSHNGSTLSIMVQFISSPDTGSQDSRCVFAGPWVQAGRLGSVSSSWNCTVGTAAANAGNFTITSIEAGTSGFAGKFHGNDQFCTYDGQFGGVRDVPF